MAQISKPSDSKKNDAVTEDLEKQLPQVPFITTITQMIHGKKFIQKKSNFT